jgi:adenosine deaminase CECR1
VSQDVSKTGSSHSHTYRVWARLNQATRCFKGLINYKSVYKWYIREAINHMIEEKIMYAELRPMLLDKFIPADSGLDTKKIDRAAQMQLIIDVVKDKQDELKKNHESKKFPFGLKIIYCTPRSIDEVRMKEEMMACIDLKLKYPELICGKQISVQRRRRRLLTRVRFRLSGRGRP